MKTFKEWMLENLLDPQGDWNNLLAQAKQMGIDVNAITQAYKQRTGNVPSAIQLEPIIKQQINQKQIATNPNNVGSTQRNWAPGQSQPNPNAAFQTGQYF